MLTPPLCLRPYTTDFKLTDPRLQHAAAAVAEKGFRTLSRGDTCSTSRWLTWYLKSADPVVVADRERITVQDPVAAVSLLDGFAGRLRETPEGAKAMEEWLMKQVCHHGLYCGRSS